MARRIHPWARAGARRALRRFPLPLPRRSTYVRTPLGTALPTPGLSWPLDSSLMPAFDQAETHLQGRLIMPGETVRLVRTMNKWAVPERVEVPFSTLQQFRVLEIRGGIEPVWRWSPRYSAAVPTTYGAYFPLKPVVLGVGQDFAITVRNESNQPARFRGQLVGVEVIR